MMRHFVSAWLLFALNAQAGRPEILWDRWGTPHIFASTEEDTYEAFGWAQARNHINVMLRLYGEARGRGAEYWGASALDTDRWVFRNSIPSRSQVWLRQQSPEFRRLLDAFVRGVNGYATAEPGSVDASVRPVLPVTAVDLIAHAQRVVHFHFVTRQGRIEELANRVDRGGSNAMAISRAKSASGNTLLLQNPHLPWDPLTRWFEAHLVTKGRSVYGATLVGFPVLSMAFQKDLGWAHTVNTFDGQDLFELRLQGDGYLWDGAVRSFERERHTLKIRQPEGTLQSTEFIVERSIHGPVVAKGRGRAVALRVTGLDQPGALEQWWRMSRARNLREFEAAMETLQIPMMTTMYGDRAGNILHLYNGRVPKRPAGAYDWSGIVPGDTSETLWTETLPYSALPRFLNPTAGWLQNANDPPWLTTLPRMLDPTSFPAYLAPRRLGARPQRALEMLSASGSVSFDDVVRMKHDTRVNVAQRILPDLLKACAASGDPRIRSAADVLRAWDQRTDTKSRGAHLFASFFVQLHQSTKGQPFAEPWREEAPLQTPSGLADPKAAVGILADVVERFDAGGVPLDVPWGEIHRFRRDGVDAPASGGIGDLGIYRVIDFQDSRDGVRHATGGDSYYAVIEFGKVLRAKVLNGPGNATQAGSPHLADQLALMAIQEMRTALLTRDAVLKELARKEQLP